MSRSSQPFFSLSVEEEQELLKVARRSIEHGLSDRQPLAVQAGDFSITLQEPRAVFVTLRVEQALRGCVGTTEATAPLVTNVARYAYLSAFNDSRFAEIDWEDYARLEIQISILSPAVPVNFQSETELLNQLRPGVDGLILAAEGKRATFLPSVWESLRTPREFWQNLKRKAGLSPTYWSDDIEVQRYVSYCISSEAGSPSP